MRLVKNDCKRDTGISGDVTITTHYLCKQVFEF